MPDVDNNGFACQHDGKGFWLKFSNGYTVSVQFDKRKNYCDEDGRTAEYAVWKDMDDGSTKWDSLGCASDDVHGYATPDEVADVIARVSSWNADREPVSATDLRRLNSLLETETEVV